MDLAKTSAHLHFVGFRDDREYWSAVGIWGKPDFIHLHHDYRMYGDVDKTKDTIVFGSKASPSYICAYSWQDCEQW